MFQGNWKCSGCGGAITELPFEPRSESGLTCRTCYAKGKEDEAGSTPPAAGVGVPDDRDIPSFDPSDAPAVDSGDAPAVDQNGQAAETTTEKPKFTGDWKCSGCGGSITSLPFEPRGDANLKCMDCYKNSKG